MRTMDVLNSSLFFSVPLNLNFFINSHFTHFEIHQKCLHIYLQ